MPSTSSLWHDLVRQDRWPHLKYSSTFRFPISKLSRVQHRNQDFLKDLQHNALANSWPDRVGVMRTIRDEEEKKCVRDN